jgi:hypothetical protein
VEDECTVGQIVERRIVVSLPARIGVDALVMQLGIDRVGARLSRMQLLPGLDEAVVIGAAAECAGAVTGRERGRLVEEEQLGELAGLKQWPSLPVVELELARDPAPAVVAPPDPAAVVVQTAAIPVDKPALRGGDQLAEWGDAVLAHP